jgi:hypothetical protein
VSTPMLISVRSYLDTIKITMSDDPSGGNTGGSTNIITLRGYEEVAWLRDALAFHMHNMTGFAPHSRVVLGSEASETPGEKADAPR